MIWRNCWRATSHQGITLYWYWNISPWIELEGVISYCIRGKPCTLLEDVVSFNAGRCHFAQCWKMSTLRWVLPAMPEDTKLGGQNDQVRSPNWEIPDHKTTTFVRGFFIATHEHDQIGSLLLYALGRGVWVKALWYVFSVFFYQSCKDLEVFCQLTFFINQSFSFPLPIP